MISQKLIAWFSRLNDKMQLTPQIIHSVAISDAGLSRENNEDSYLSLPDYKTWAVADGMGGHDSGEVASAIAMTSFRNAIVAGKDLVAAIQSSHFAIETSARQGEGSKEMGSTIVALQIRNNNYQIAWVGDSRAYLYRSELKCLSKDHSYIQLMIDQGLITDHDAQNHPYKNAITQALGGIGKPVTVDTVRGKLEKGDIFLLCSDGLSGEISADDIEETLSHHTSSLTEKMQSLVKKALTAGGKDNITLILVEA